MNITSVRVRKVDIEGKMKGIASITFDDEFVVKDIRIINGESGLFVVMPSRKTSTGYRDVAHPLNQDVRDRIQESILSEFEKIQNSPE